MEQTIPAPGYLGVAIQWTLFLALVCTWLIPAFLFSNLARKHNKKPWPFFLGGVALGALSMLLTGFMMRPLHAVAGTDEVYPYLMVMFLLLPVLVWIGALKILKRSFARSA